jgi:hypothetical protein
MFQTKAVVKIKTYILRSITLSPANRAIYEQIWKDLVQPYGPQMKIWRLCTACWITKAANTLRTTVSTETTGTRTRLNVTLYVQCMSRVRLRKHRHAFLQRISRKILPEYFSVCCKRWVMETEPGLLIW